MMISQPWYKEFWPWFLMAGPAVVVIASFITLGLALRSDDGLVADDYYKQGKEINMLLQRDQMAQNLGLQAKIMLGDQGIRVMLAQALAGTMPSTLILRFIDPTRAGQDRAIQLHQVAEGLYAGDLPPNLRHSRWYISLEDQKNNWRLTGAWRMNESDSLQLNALASKK